VFLASTRTFAKAAENPVLDTVDFLLQILFLENSSHQSRKSQVQNSQQKAKERKEASTKLSEENSKKSSEKTTRHQSSSTENESELMLFTTRI